MTRGRTPSAGGTPSGPSEVHGEGLIRHEGAWFRDLDHDGRVSPYEDWRLPTETRARDLLRRMSLAEKAGAMLHGTLPATGRFGMLGYGPEYDLAAAETLMLEAKVTAAITRLAPPPRAFAAQNNALQIIAARGRLGIPLLVSTDPRHHFRTAAGVSNAAAGLSQWPETLGLAAIGDVGLVRAFGDTVRREYRALGIHMALSPQADLATSPMWPRIEGTFGEDPARVRALVGAYVEGVQGGRLGPTPDGVAAVVKHWVGYGAARDGFDGHNSYGRYSAFPGGALQAHINAFLDAFAFGVSGVMPTYNILEDASVDGRPVEPVGAGFSRLLLTGLLRERHGFDGVILSDWAISKDANSACLAGDPPQTPADIAMPWGVETLTAVERVALGVNAGLDQFGGESDPALLLQAVHEGRISEATIDACVLRILRQTFALGLFERPFVDPDEAEAIVGQPAFVEAAARAQRRSVVALKTAPGPALPPGVAVLVHGMSAEPFHARGVATSADPRQAAVAVVRLRSPYQTLHPTFFFGSRQHEGDLDFKNDDPDLGALRALPPDLPVIFVAHLDRPTVLTPVLARATRLYVAFGVSDAVLLDVLTGEAPCEGRLPFSLPRDMARVRARRWDVPDDDPDPLFPLGFSASGA